jgi:hypothetical protein
MAIYVEFVGKLILKIMFLDFQIISTDSSFCVDPEVGKL